MIQEPMASPEDLTSTFEHALAVGVVLETPSATDLFLQRASFQSRMDDLEIAEGRSLFIKSLYQANLTP